MIVSQRQRADSAVADGEGVERRQVECTPHFNDALVAGCHQVFAVARQQHALDSEGESKSIYRFDGVCGAAHLKIVVVRLVTQQAAVDREGSDVPLVVVDDNEAFAGHRDVLGRQEFLRGVE